MTPSELLEEARIELDDTIKEYLHSDRSIYMAMASAQRELAIATECMRGTTTATIATSIPVPANVFHPTCVIHNGKEYPLLAGPAPLSDEGPVLQFYHGDNRIEVFKKQASDINIVIRAILIPEVDPSEDNDNFEIDVPYHRFLLSGTVYYCLRRLDADVKEFRKVREWFDRWTSDINSAYNLTALRVRRAGTVRYGGY